MLSSKLYDEHPTQPLSSMNISIISEFSPQKSPVWRSLLCSINHIYESQDLNFPLNQVELLLAAKYAPANSYCRIKQIEISHNYHIVFWLVSIFLLFCQFLSWFHSRDSPILDEWLSRVMSKPRNFHVFEINTSQDNKFYWHKVIIILINHNMITGTNQ